MVEMSALEIEILLFKMVLVFFVKHSSLSANIKKQIIKLIDNYIAITTSSQNQFFC